jgi:signal transduction histidine kinase
MSDKTISTFLPDVKTGSYASIKITDAGIGMSEETKGKIFEPFFTTKDPGKGTGLGLSVVYGIVQTHHGYIHVSSAPG